MSYARHAALATPTLCAVARHIRCALVNAALPNILPRCLMPMPPPRYFDGDIFSGDKRAAFDDAAPAMPRGDVAMMPRRRRAATHVFRRHAHAVA